MKVETYIQKHVGNVNCRPQRSRLCIHAFWALRNLRNPRPQSQYKNTKYSVTVCRNPSGIFSFFFSLGNYITVNHIVMLYQTTALDRYGANENEREMKNAARINTEGLSRAERFYRQVAYSVLARYDVRWGYLPESIVTLIEKLHVLQQNDSLQYTTGVRIHEMYMYVLLSTCRIFFSALQRWICQ